MVHGVIESVNMGSTHYAERIFDAVCTSDVDNGTFGYLDGLKEGMDNVYKFVAGAPTGGQPIVVVDQPAWTEDTQYTSNQRKDKFFVGAGTVFRVRAVKTGDEFGVNIAAIADSTANTTTGVVARETVEGVTNFGTTAVYLTIGTDGKLVAATQKTAGAVMEARIMRKRVKGDTLVTGARTYGYSYAIYEAKIEKLA